MAEPRFVTTPQGTVEVIMDEQTYQALVSSNSPDPLLLRDLTLEQLKVLAEGKLTTDTQAQLSGLIQKEKAGKATIEESATLDKLLHQLDQLNMLKAKAFIYDEKSLWNRLRARTTSSTLTKSYNNSMEITLTLPEELASQLHQEDVTRILQLGLRELNTKTALEFSNTAQVIETLASLPTPEQILALRPSAEFQERIGALLEKNRELGLSEREQQEWASYEFTEHIVRLAKANALSKTKH